MVIDGPTGKVLGKVTLEDGRVLEVREGDSVRIDTPALHTIGRSDFAVTPEREPTTITGTIGGEEVSGVVVTYEEAVGEPIPPSESEPLEWAPLTREELVARLREIEKAWRATAPEECHPADIVLESCADEIENLLSEGTLRGEVSW